MALIVEDGDGLENAVSLVSVDDADIYHRQRRNAAWDSLSTPEKEACLIQATDFITQTYWNRWKGCRMTDTQALDWPRYGVCVQGRYISDGIVPTAVENACAELALRVRTNGALNPDYERPVKSEKVGPLETVYADNTSNRPSYNAIEQMLSPFCIGGSSLGVPLVRT
jgi:hypothetical protein